MMRTLKFVAVFLILFLPPLSDNLAQPNCDAGLVDKLPDVGGMTIQRKGSEQTARLLERLCAGDKVFATHTGAMLFLTAKAQRVPVSPNETIYVPPADPTREALFGVFQFVLDNLSLSGERRLTIKVTRGDEDPLTFLAPDLAKRSARVRPGTTEIVFAWIPSEPPYEISVTSDDNKSTSWTTEEAEAVLQTSLKFGEAMITLRDSRGFMSSSRLIIDDSCNAETLESPKSFQNALKIIELAKDLPDSCTTYAASRLGELGRRNQSALLTEISNILLRGEAR